MSTRTTPPPPYRREFVEALNLLARAAEDVAARGLAKPILVGGGAVEYYTASAIPSGDLDLIVPDQDAIESALLRLGFERPGGAGTLARGLVHRGLKMGVEVVSGTLMDGKADEAHLRILGLDGGDLPIIGIEDLIADRMGQSFSAPRGVPEMLGQARELFAIARLLDNPFDPSYLDRRLREETVGECDLDEFRRMIDADQSK